ncbi:MAG: TolC family protein [Acidobacteria bacterium]|nr:TolC family protein [Acidobacteriota bacterium]
MSQATLRHAGMAVVLVLATASANAQGLTEKEAISRFLSEHPQSREMRAAVAATTAETRAWTLWPNPVPSFSREGAGLAEFAQVQQQLPFNGRLRWLRQAGSEAVSAAQSQSEFARWEMISAIRIAFFDVLSAQEREAAIQTSMERLQEVIGILREREKEGEGSAYDRLRAERELSEFEADLAISLASAAEARGRLAAFLGDPTNSSEIRVRGELRGSAALPPLEELLRRAIETRADLETEKHAHEQFVYQSRAAERLRIPDPIIGVGIKRGELATGATGIGSFVAVTIPIPIFNRGTEEMARFRAEAERAEARSEALERRIRGEVAGLYAALETRRTVALEYSRRLATQGEQLENITRTAFEEGEVGILGLLDALRVSAQARRRWIDLNAAAKLAELQLEQTAGAPILNPEVLP